MLFLGFLGNLFIISGSAFSKPNAAAGNESVTKLTQSKIYVTDKEKIVSSSIKNDINIGLDNKIIELMRERKGDEGFNISIGNKKTEEYYYMLPIIVDADSIGAVLVLNSKEINDQDKLIANLLNILLSSLVY